MQIENLQIRLADQYIRYTNQHVFLTGKAGTGKTTFLKNLKLTTDKRIMVVAPTGVAAINAGGVTIHSLFQIPFGPFIPGRDISGDRFRFSNEKIKTIQAIDLLVIDEISMVRSDLLDAIDTVLRRFRIRHKPFGGVQLLMIGDLYQLAPVIKEEEWEILRHHYASQFFFDSLALKSSQFITIELLHIYRQSDDRFIALLNKVRDHQLDQDAISILNHRYQPGLQIEDLNGYIMLTTHNSSAVSINRGKLESLDTKSFFYKAIVTDDFPESMYPNEENLELKVGAQIMFVRNDVNKLYYNGLLGKVSFLSNNEIKVKPEGSTHEISVAPATWENIKYVLDENKQMREDLIGTFTQYPLKPAWAITIHKSQGLTFDKAIIDARASFAHGQVYVALSRCRSLEGLILSTPIDHASIKTDQTIHSFKNFQEAASEKSLFQARHHSQQDWIKELFSFNDIGKKLHRLDSLVKANADLLPDPVLKSVQDIALHYFKDIDDVVNKFNAQLSSYLHQEMLPESNEALKVRIIKGAAYLYDKCKSIVLDPLTHIRIELDHKEQQKTLSDARLHLMKSMFEKMAELQSCKTGFDTHRFLQARANASIDFDQLRNLNPKTKLKSHSPVSPSDIDEEPVIRYTSKDDNHSLYDQLRQWRDQVANAAGLASYQVLQQKTIKSISTELPANLTALSNIPGIGPAKLAQYGNILLNIVNEYCDQNGLTQKMDIPGDRKKKHKNKAPHPLSQPPEKIDTYAASFNMFTSGKSIVDIALERKLGIGTIVGHLSRYVEKGDLDIESILPREKIKAIQSVLLSLNDGKSGTAKEKLGEDYTYGEIRMVMVAMKSNHTLS